MQKIVECQEEEHNEKKEDEGLMNFVYIPALGVVSDAAAAASAAAFSSESVRTEGEVRRILHVINGCRSLILVFMITIVSACLSRIVEYLVSGEMIFYEKIIIL